MGKDYNLAFIKYVDAFDECWDDNGFWPNRESRFSKTELVVFATSCCYDFFITNGLWGLFESELGKAYPEFVRGCQFFDCQQTVAICNRLDEELFSNKFPRNTIERKKIVLSDAIIERLDSLNPLLDIALDEDMFEAKLHSYCKYRLDRLKMKPFEAAYTLKLDSDPSWEILWNKEIL